VYNPLKIDRKNVSIMGVKFPDLASLEATAKAIGSNMYEGFVPTPALIQLYLDWKRGVITPTIFFERLKQHYELPIS
jgi:putative transcriptional regulator